MAEHMRIGLLDPKWREQKDRMEEEVRKNKEAWALGQAGSVDVLKGIATRRTDIFGRDDFSGDADQATGPGGRKKMTWDGVTQDAAHAQRQAAEAARDEAARVKAREDAARKEREEETAKRKRDANIGPAAPDLAPGMAPPEGAPPAPYGMPMPGMMPPGMMYPGMAPMVPPPNLAAGLMTVPSMPAASAAPPAAGAVPPPPPAADTAAAAAAPSTEDERPAKRIRTDGFMDEGEWIAEHPAQFTLSVQCPVLEGKYNGGVTGQVLSIEVELTDKVSEVKAKIQAACGMPPGKQTLKVWVGLRLVCQFSQVRALTAVSFFPYFAAWFGDIEQHQQPCILQRQR